MTKASFWLMLENASTLEELANIVQAAKDAIGPYSWAGFDVSIGNYDLGDQEIRISANENCLELPQELIDSLERAGFEVVEDE